MAVNTKIYNGALVYREDAYTQRWLDAFGENVVKYFLGVGESFDDASGDPTGWTNTETGTNTIIAHTTEGGGFKITTGASEYNGVNLQRTGSAFKLESGKPLYFGCKCKTENATKGDMLVGLCEVDTTLMATSAAHALSVTDDGVYFYKLSAQTDVTFVNELSGTEGKTAIGGTHDTEYHVYEIYYDGSQIFAYFDDSLVVNVTSGLAAVALTPSINFRAGDDGAEVLDVQWMRVIQLR